MSDAEQKIEKAQELTREMRAALGWGSVEYAEGAEEFVIWPLGEPYGSPEQVRAKIEKLKGLEGET